MGILDKLRKRSKKQEGQAEYVICPHCGAGYDTRKIMLSISIKSPFIEDLASWSTRVVCSMCKSEFGVSGSYRHVFGQPRPK